MVRLTLMLCDHADAVNGKLYINGGGWSVIGPQPTPGGIGVAMKIPWDEREDQHVLRFDLLDSDGHPVRVIQTPQGIEPLWIEGTIQMEGSFDGVKPGTPIDAVFAVNYGPLPLAPGSRYEWRATVNGAGHEDWFLAFSTRPLDASAAEAA